MEYTDNYMAITLRQEIQKKHVSDMVQFAIKHIPTIDVATLETFVELMNATGNHGFICTEQLSNTIRLTSKYVPGMCNQTLLILVELLSYYVSVSSTDMKPVLLDTLSVSSSSSAT